MSLRDMRPAADAMAAEISTLALDRAVHERFVGIIQQNPGLLTAAQHRNPLLNGVRRWWSTTAAMTLRRHVDPGSSTNLRALVEGLAEDESDSRHAQFQVDIETLGGINRRFRPYFNALVHQAEPVAEKLTFDDLGETIDVIRRIAERAYAALTQISYEMNPVIQFDWTAIFKEPWLPEVAQAYDLGTDDVPADALALTRAESEMLAYLRPEISLHRGGAGHVELENIGRQVALDVRLFMPIAQTVIDVDEVAVGAKVGSRAFPSDLGLRSAQIIVEFEDLQGRVYREYADITLSSLRMRNLRGPYLVKGRIVAPALVPTNVL